MRNMLAFLAAVLLAFLGLGWYLDWYAVKPVKTDPGTRSYTIQIDSKKIGTDVAKYGQKVQNMLDKDDGKAIGPADKKTTGLPLSTPRFDLGEEAEPRK